MLITSQSLKKTLPDWIMGKGCPRGDCDKGAFTLAEGSAYSVETGEHPYLACTGSTSGDLSKPWASRGNDREAKVCFT